MKVAEFIEAINSKGMCSLWEVHDTYGYGDNAPKRVAEGLSLDEHRWYSTAVNVYECEDGYVGVFGAYQSFSEMQNWEDLDVTCEASEYEPVQTTTYKPKKS